MEGTGRGTQETFGEESEGQLSRDSQQWPTMHNFKNVLIQIIFARGRSSPVHSKTRLVPPPDSHVYFTRVVPCLHLGLSSLI